MGKGKAARAQLEDEAARLKKLKKKAKKAGNGRTVDQVKMFAAENVAEGILGSRKMSKAKRAALADAADLAKDAGRVQGQALQVVGRALAGSPAELASLLRVGEGFELAQVDPSGTPGFPGSRAEGEAALAAVGQELSELQERLFAAATAGATDSVLLLVQGMDTSGKGGITRHVVGLLDPQGVRITAFKAPTPQERARGFLWRIRAALPAPGMIGVFDRSQYEDVLVARVNHLTTKQVWSRRYESINTFEAQARRKGIRVVKVMLHIGPDEQRKRLAERLERPDKYWKFRPGDLDDRARWDEFQAAYQDALVRCSTDSAPWYVVPADHKWYARWAVCQLLLGALREIDPQWPPADFDVAREQERLAEL